MIIDKECFNQRKGVGSGKLHCCEECFRYKWCVKGKNPPINYYEGALRLGMAVVGQVVLDYEKAFKKGWKNRLNYCDKWFRTTRTDILTAEQYNGSAIADALAIKCEKKYGKFETIYNREQKRIKKAIKELQMQVVLVETNDERKELNKKIRKLRGEKNL